MEPNYEEAIAFLQKAITLLNSNRPVEAVDLMKAAETSIDFALDRAAYDV